MNPDDERNRFDKTPDGHDPQRPSRPPFARGFVLWAIVLGLMLAAFLFMRRANTQDIEEWTLAKFDDHLMAAAMEDPPKGLDSVQSIEVKENWIIAQLASGKRVKVNAPPRYTSDPLVIKRWITALPADEPKALQDPSPGIWPAILSNVVPLLLLILLMIYFLNRQMRMANAREGGFPFLKSNVRLAHKERTGITFEDVAGVDEAKEELEETVEFLKNPEKFRTIGGRIPRGIILLGHPGTGKTLLARAVAGEANVPFFSLCGSDFVELFVGVGAARVRDLFQQARENQPCIIFLDEIDAVGRKRGAGLGGGHDEREQTLNAILSEMDGFARDEGIIVMAATNRADVLDSALLRPGRFDRQISVDLPDLKGREAILRVHARKVKLADGVEMDVIARGTPGCSGADLEAIVNEAALLAASSSKKRVELSDLEEARDKVLFGRKRKSRVMTEQDRRITAFHEAGHALVAVLHPDVEPLHKVTIIPRGMTLGQTMILPETDKYNLRKRECLGQLVLAMSGRVSEELFCDDISAGAKNDIENATKLARKMVTQWGMSERVGPVCYSDEEEHVFLGNEISRPRRHGEQVSQQIDEEVKGLMERSHQDARTLCHKRAHELQAVAEALLKLETLSGEEVKRIIDGEGPDDLVSAREVIEAAAKEKQAAASDRDQLPEGPAAGDLPAPAGSPA